MLRRNTADRIATVASTLLFLLLLLPLYPSAAQAAPPDGVKVTGKVVDEQGEPLPGASIRVKGTTLGAAADIDGAFTLTVASKQKVTLVVSFIGMVTQEVTATPGTPLTIMMEEEGGTLDELIVSGFQTISRERATGSATIVNNEKLQKVLSVNLSSKLEGLTPGLVIYNNDMSIRGTSSFAVDTTPLLVIDGQPATGISLNDVNPEIIENVTVLKDAAATSLYGVRAANGVIVITTKQGRSDKLSVNLSAGFYLHPMPSLSYQHYASTSDIIDMEREYLTTDPDYMNSPTAFFNNLTSKSKAAYLTPLYMLYYRMAQGEIDETQLNTAVDALRTLDYRKEYRKKLMQMAVTQDYNVSVMKGGEKYNLFASARFQDTGQYTKFNNSSRAQFYLKNEVQMARWMKLTMGADLSFGKSDFTQASGLGYAAAMPYDRLYDDDGNLAYRYPYNQVLAEQVATVPGLYSMGYNAVEESGNNVNKTDNLYMKLFLQSNFTLTKDLDFEVKLQYERRSQNGEEYDEADSYMMRSRVNEFAVSNGRDGFDYAIPRGGRLYTSHAGYNYYNVRGQFNYNKTFGEAHNLTALLGGEIRQDKYRAWNSERYGYDDQKLTYSQVDWASLSQNGVIGQLYDAPRRLSENLFVGDTTHRYVSAYFNAGYTYASRYAVNLSMRVDQADLFGTDPKYRYRPLWSVGGSWNASNETFMKDIHWVNMLKVRATYGVTGNVDQSSSPYLLAGYVTSPYTNSPVSTILTPPNSTLRWEQVSTLNIGIDFRLIGKLSGSLDFYSKYSSDLLVNKSIDPSLGFNGQARANNGEMQNTGVELTLAYDWLKKRDLSFTTTFTAAYNKNTIKKIDYEPTDAIEMMSAPGDNYRVGDAYRSLYAYRYAGLTDNGDPSVYDENGQAVSITPVRSVDAVVVAGQLIPAWSGALTLDFKWKALNVYMKTVYYAGHSLRDDVVTLYDAYNPINSGAIREDIVDRWTTENTTTSIPAMARHANSGERNYHWRYADVNVSSATFVKIRNIGILYALPKTILNKVGIKGVTLKAQIDNPLYWTANNRDIDPEAFNANSGTRNAAIMPSYTLGVNINL